MIVQIMKDKKNQLIEELQIKRKNDRYLNDDIEKTILDHFFPSNTVELVDSMSNVTASFYGLLMKFSTENLGDDYTKRLSEKLFYELGRMKAGQALHKMPDMPHNSKSFINVFIFTVYTSSPGYSFSIDKYTDSHSILKISGTDRYHQISTLLKITSQLNWPPFMPFMSGIKDRLSLTASPDLKFSNYERNSQCTALIEFK